MEGWIIGLTVVGTVMQATALVRYLARAARDLRRLEEIVQLRGSNRFRLDDLKDEYAGDIRGPARKARSDLTVDVMLIGGGGILLAVSSIWGLYLT